MQSIPLPHEFPEFPTLNLSCPFYLTDPTTITLLFPGRAVVIDKKTLKVVDVVPEMGDPNWQRKETNNLAAAAALLVGTAHLEEGADALRKQLAKFVVSENEKLMKTLTAAVGVFA